MSHFTLCASHEIVAILCSWCVICVACVCSVCMCGTSCHSAVNSLTVTNLLRCFFYLFLIFPFHRSQPRKAARLVKMTSRPSQPSGVSCWALGQCAITLLWKDVFRTSWTSFVNVNNLKSSFYILYYSLYYFVRLSTDWALRQLLCGTAASATKTQGPRIFGLCH